MRILFFLLLFLHALESTGQHDTVHLVSLDDALAIAFRNNSTLPDGKERKLLIRDIKSAWFQWLYQIHKLRSLEEQLKLTGDIDRIARLRYEEGDIDLLQKSWLMNKLAEVRTSIAMASNDIEITSNDLQRFLKSPVRIEPASDGLAMYQINKGSRNSPVLLNQADSLRFKNLQLNLDNCFIHLQFFETTGLEHAHLVIKIHQARLNTEESDYIEYSAGIAEAFDIEQEYLETLNNYNQTAIELEHYAY